MLIPAPRNGRDVFEAFRRYDPEQGINPWLQSIDLLTTPRRQAIFAVIGRLPEPPPVGQSNVVTNGRLPFSNALHSEEFQRRLMVRLLTSYEEKKRLLFVHVPKCAGSDLTVLLMNRYPAFNARLTERNWFPTAKLFAEIKKLVDALAYSETIFVHGHVPLRRYLQDGCVRATDHVFTTVRDPLDMVVSQINYILTRFSRDPELKAIDTRDWLRFLDHDQIKAAIESGDYRDVGRQILRTPQLVEPNRVCQYLGDGTAAVAFENCARAEAEIAHVDTYARWLETRWGIVSDTRQNASAKLVTLEALGDEARRRAEELTQEDRIFVRRVEEKLRASESAAISGGELRG